MEEKSRKEFKDMVEDIMDEDDIAKFYYPETSDVQKYNLASKYLSKSRESFFASLDNEMCDIQKAKDFHKCYKLSDALMKIIARKFSKDLSLIPLTND